MPGTYYGNFLFLQKCCYPTKHLILVKQVVNLDFILCNQLPDLFIVGFFLEGVVPGQTGLTVIAR
jgi:hypothetical protein